MVNGKERNRERGVLLQILLSFCFTTVCTVLAIVFLQGVKTGVFAERKKVFSVAVSVLFLVLYGVSVWAGIAEKKATFRFLAVGYFLATFSLVIAIVLQRSGFFEVVKDSERLKQYLRGAGRWMPAVYVLLQYLQVVVLPVPGIVSTAAGVALFGPLATTAYSFIGVVLGSLTAFYIGRRFGSRAVAWAVGEENAEKWRDKLEGKDRFLLTAAFLLPVFPDDILCFAAGLSSMSFRYFAWTTVWARGISIVATAYFVGVVPRFGAWGFFLPYNSLKVLISIYQ